MRETEDNQTEQKEHLSLNNTGYNNVLNATKFFQKRWVWINILTKIKYSCDKCGKQFTKLGSMKKHIQSAHEGVMFPCDQYYYQATQDFWKIWWICPKYHCDHCGKKSIHKVILKHIFSLFMKVSSILVISFIIKLQEWVVYRGIISLNMKVIWKDIQQQNKLQKSLVSSVVKNFKTEHSYKSHSGNTWRDEVCLW